MGTSASDRMPSVVKWSRGVLWVELSSGHGRMLPSAAVEFEGALRSEARVAVARSCQSFNQPPLGAADAGVVATLGPGGRLLACSTGAVRSGLPFGSRKPKCSAHSFRRRTSATLLE